LLLGIREICRDKLWELIVVIDYTWRVLNVPLAVREFLPNHQHIIMLTSRKILARALSVGLSKVNPNDTDTSVLDAVIQSFSSCL
jgi:hypothetical protein